ncbi:MAG TPA: hypothetical protein VF659_04610 [Pyrinomonadaceae bacterium]
MAFPEADCSTGCGRYVFETDSNTASCIDSRTPPEVCPRPVAITQAGKPCIKYRVRPFLCGFDQPCQKDEKDEAGTLTCGECKDEDNDGYSTCDGDCDDSNTVEGFNTHPGAPEICGNDRNDNCDREGKVDETPCCDASDHDQDGASDCDGDCNDDDPTDTKPPCPTPTPTPTPTPPAGGGCTVNWWVASWCDDYDFELCTCPGGINKSPVLVDVLGNGFSLTDARGGVNFDLDGDGTAERLSWTSPGSDDAFLALDHDGNGRIEYGTELFGNYTPQPPPPAGRERNGFLALAEFDRPARGGNGDGLIDDRDAVFPSLRLWRDSNHDGVSQPEELHALAGLGLKSVDLGYKESRRTDEHGNRFRFRAKVGDAKGAKAGRWAWDVFLVSGQ